MQDEKLPKYYKGYLTDELLKVWDQIKNCGIPESVPEKKILAMSDLFREYRLAPVHCK